jgi:hypothetical protein
LTLYPLRPVVTSNPTLLPQYDDHPESISLVSIRMAPEEVIRLIDAGASFEAIVVADDVPAELQRRFDAAGEQSGGSLHVERISLAEDGAVPRVHASLRLARGAHHFDFTGG